QEDLALQVRVQRTQHGILAARQLDGDVVWQLYLGPHPSSDDRTSSETRRPSARPSTAAIACLMAVPMSFTDSAPLSRTAPAPLPRAGAAVTRRPAGRRPPPRRRDRLAPLRGRSGRPPGDVCARGARRRARPGNLPWPPSAARTARVAAPRPLPSRQRASRS